MKLPTQLHLCNYCAETEKVLLHDLFLFGLEDESFMSKIISEENPEITTAQLWQKLKCMEGTMQLQNTSKELRDQSNKLSTRSVEKGQNAIPAKKTRAM